MPGLPGGAVGLREALNTPGEPNQAACEPCDMNCDGSIDAIDIETFIGLLFDAGVPCDTCSGDTNADGTIDAADIDGFIECLFP